MKKTLIAGAILGALAATPAAAADLPVKAIAPTPAWNWTGFYVGGNVGGGMGAVRFDDPCFTCSSATPTDGFFTGGVQAGYNYQFGNGLIGIEADVNGNSDFRNTVVGGDDALAVRTGLKADVSGTIRARAGVTMNNTLLYVTGGAAWANVRQSGAQFDNRANRASFGQLTGLTANSTDLLWGGVIGAGFEYALSPNWSVGGEFLHTTYTDGGARFINLNGASACGPINPATCVLRSQLTTDIARLRLNYRFGDPAGAQAYAWAPAAKGQAGALVPYSWSGFYVGGNAGGGMASTAFTDPCYYCSTSTPTGGFFTGGVQAGYNYQFGNGLIGVEADVNGNSRFKKSVIGGVQFQALTVGVAANVSGTIRARAGAVANNALLYVTAGVAWANASQSGVEFGNIPAFAGFGLPTGRTANASGTLWGSVVGAGVEYALSPNWTVGAEFLHTVYGDRDAAILQPDGTSGCAPNHPPTNCVIRSQLTADVARLRVNYRFGGGGDPAAAQPPATAYRWTGFYVGGNAGGGMAATSFTDPCFYCSATTPTGSYFTGGVQAGYNYQLGKGLLGIEADVNGNNGSKNSVIGGNQGTAMTVGLKADVSGTIRARAGLVANNALIYATGGAAWANVQQSGVDFDNVVTNSNLGRPTGNVFANASATLWGGVIGAGVEYALSPNWTVGGEFLHTAYRDLDANLRDADGRSMCNNLPATNCVIRSQLTTDVARVRLNYRFGG